MLRPGCVEIRGQLSHSYACVTVETPNDDITLVSASFLTSVFLLWLRRAAGPVEYGPTRADLFPGDLVVHTRRAREIL